LRIFDCEIINSCHIFILLYFIYTPFLVIMHWNLI
jgi:hypothetical protein